MESQLESDHGTGINIISLSSWFRWKAFTFHYMKITKHDKNMRSVHSIIKCLYFQSTSASSISLCSYQISIETINIQAT